MKTYLIPSYFQSISILTFFLFCLLFQNSYSWCLRTKFAGKTSIQSVDFSPDGQYIITGQTSGRVMLWKSDTLQILTIYQFAYKLWEATYSKNQQLIAVAGENNLVDILNATSLTLIRQVLTNHTKVYDVDFRYDSQTMVTCGADSKAKIFNASSGALINQTATTNIPYSCQYGDNNWIAVSGFTFVQSYDLTLTRVFKQVISTETFYQVRVAPGSIYSIAVSNLAGNVLQSNIGTSSTSQFITGSSGGLYACAYSRDSAYFAVGGANHIVYLFDATTGQLAAPLLSDSVSNFKTAQFSIDGNNLVFGDENGTVHFYQKFCSGCPVGSYQNLSSCQYCSQVIPGCSICVSSINCTSCFSGYYLPSNATLCSSCSIMQGCANCNSSTNCTTCLPGYYKNGLICTQCLDTQYGCQQCTGPLQCIQCDQNSYLNAGICTKCTTVLRCIYCNSSTYCMECQPGYYSNSGVCTVCNALVNPGCAVCINSTVCTSCLTGYRLNTSNLCQKCAAQCIFCNSTNHCFQCISDMYLTSLFTCQFCVSPCETCTSLTYCLTCLKGYYLSTVGVCTGCLAPCLSCNSSTRCQTCFQGYFLNSTNVCDKCTTIDANCRFCKTGVCITCQPDYTLSFGVCTRCTTFMRGCSTCNATNTCSQCLDGFYLTGLSANNSCYLCPKGCSNCLNGTNCSACLPGYYLFNSACNLCDSKCLSCTSSSTSTCTSCIEGFYLSTTAIGICFNCSIIPNCIVCHNSSYCIGCGIGFFLSSPTVCQTCTSPCATCKASSTYCLTCALGYYISTASGSNSCAQCSYGCSQCNTSTICISCIIGYYYNSATYTCIQCRISLPGCNVCSNSTNCVVCSSGYFPLVGTCQSCQINIASCLKCNVLGTICSLCDYGYALSSTNTSCISCSFSLPNCQNCISSAQCQTCNAGYFINGIDCTQCLTGCIVCSNSTVCQVCFDLYTLLPTKVCQLCESAIYGCQMCSSITNCTSCVIGFYSTGANCSLCRNSLQGCQLCANSTACTFCSIRYQLQPNNTCVLCSKIYSNCQTCGNSTIACLECSGGYFLNTGICASCNPGASEGCKKCLSSTQCLQCMNGYYLNPLLTCTKCDATYSNCIYCDPTVCIQCESGYYLSLGVCNKCPGGGCEVCGDTNPLQCVTCNVRYYNDNKFCKLCSIAMPECVQCNTNASCIECASGFYVTASDQCDICSNKYPGCSICTSSICSDCITNFFLNSTNQCDKCNNYLVGCSFCISESICLSCQSGYYFVNQTCEHCSSISGCLYCVNDTLCIQCQQSYFLSLNDTNCYKCSLFIHGCYACTDSFTCISCQGHYQLTAGQCKQIRGQVIRITPELALKSFYYSHEMLKHELYARTFTFRYFQQDWPSYATLQLVCKNYTYIPLTILNVQWSSDMTTIKFYTNNPLADQLQKNFKSMPFSKQIQIKRLLVSSSIQIDYELKLMIKQSVAQDVMPNVQQAGDLYLTYSLSDPSFYASVLRNHQYYYFIFGALVTLMLFIGFSIKLCCIVPRSQDRGGIIPHILAIKCGGLVLYPTYAEYINYCYGFMAADFPWLNLLMGTNYGSPAEIVPLPYTLYYVNLSLVSTYFLAIILVAVIWFTTSVIKYVCTQSKQKIEVYKSFLYNFFGFGVTLAGCLCLQGVIFNSITSLSMNSVLYILGIIIYLSIFVQLIYTWFSSIKNQQKSSQDDNIGLHGHMRKLRIFIKATLLSLMYLSPIHILSVLMSLQIGFILMQYCLFNLKRASPIIQSIQHLLTNISLIILILAPDVLVGLIVVSTLVIVVLILEIKKSADQSEQFQKIQQDSHQTEQQKNGNLYKTNQIQSFNFDSSQKQGQNKNQSIVYLNPFQNRTKEEQKQKLDFNIRELKSPQKIQGGSLGMTKTRKNRQTKK